MMYLVCSSKHCCVEVQPHGAFDIWRRLSDQTLPRAEILEQGSPKRIKSLVTFCLLHWMTLLIEPGAAFCRCAILSHLLLPASVEIGGKLRLDGRDVQAKPRDQRWDIQDFKNSETSKKNMNGSCTAAHSQATKCHRFFIKGENLMLNFTQWFLSFTDFNFELDI